MASEATLLISAYNSVDFINHKMDNFIEASKHAKLDVIVVDCAGGKEVEALRPKYRKHKNVKLVIYSHRITIWKAINTAIKIADTEYVVQANTDDLVHPEAYRKQIDKLNSGCDITWFNYTPSRTFEV